MISLLVETVSFPQFLHGNMMKCFEEDYLCMVISM